MSFLPVVRVHVRLPAAVLVRRCPRCDAERVHPFSGRARLNANGRHLDGWLLFTCEACARTAKLPVLERVPVRQVDRALLLALESNDPAVLEPLAASLAGGPGFRLEPTTVSGAAEILISVEAGVRARLDRVLAQLLGLSRAEIARTFPDAPLRKPVRDGQRVVAAREAR